MTQLELYYQKNTFLFIHHKYNHIVQNDWLVKYEKILIINKTTLKQTCIQTQIQRYLQKDNEQITPIATPHPSKKKLINKKMKNIFETNVRNRDQISVWFSGLTRYFGVRQNQDWS